MYEMKGMEMGKDPRKTKKEFIRVSEGLPAPVTPGQEEATRDPLEVLANRYSGMSREEIEKSVEFDADAVAQRVRDRAVRSALRKRKKH
ncbi:MAG: hypothetical protein KGI60_02440 [Patescibacteria group bacterium]|nr:hypothetical protein [Patescibacteria group bacterium]